MGPRRIGCCRGSAVQFRLACSRGSGSSTTPKTVRSLRRIKEQHVAAYATEASETDGLPERSVLGAAANVLRRIRRIGWRMTRVTLRQRHLGDCKTLFPLKNTAELQRSLFSFASRISTASLHVSGPAAAISSSVGACRRRQTATVPILHGPVVEPQPRRHIKVLSQRILPHARVSEAVLFSANVAFEDG